MVKPQNILVINCCSEPCGVLLQAGINNFYEPVLAIKATESLIPAINKLLKSSTITVNDLTAIVWNQGPGSFTSIRIAASIVQGLSTPANIKIIGFNAFEFIMAGFLKNLSPSQPEYILAAVDARVGEMYWGIYKKLCQHNRYELIQPIKVSSPETIIEFVTKKNLTINIGIGNGFTVYPKIKTIVKEIVLENNDEDNLSEIVQLALEKLNSDFNENETALLPLYIRNNIAKKSTEQIVWQKRFNVKKTN